MNKTKKVDHMIECKNIDEVRVNIDIIDREIVKLLSERSEYVKQAAKFKKNTDDVRLCENYRATLYVLSN